MSFQSMKKSSSTTIESLRAKATEENTKKSFGDDRFWKITRDKSDNGSAVIRFLPAAEGESLPWVKYWDHGFRGPGGWYIEKSRTSIDETDPVSDENSRLWATGTDANKQIARDRKRRLHYVANIMVLSDPAHPENEGKIFLYQFGKRIFDKVMDVMTPEFEDITPINPFDFWEGANFRLRVRKVEGWINYDKSDFSNPVALSDDDTKLETIYDDLYKLQEMVDPSTYKSYNELQTKMNRVLGTTVQNESWEADVSVAEEAIEPRVVSEDSPLESAPAEDADDTLSYFSKLATD